MVLVVVDAADFDGSLPRAALEGLFSNIEGYQVWLQCHCGTALRFLFCSFAACYSAHEGLLGFCMPLYTLEGELREVELYRLREIWGSGQAGPEM